MTAPTSLALPAGRRLQEFVVQSTIGEGGFGIVYLAHDISLDRTVAIKEYMPAVLAGRRDDYFVTVRSEQNEEAFAAGLRGFLNEARILAQFDHPNLVKVYRFWEENGTAYMVMPYYRAPTLKRWLSQNPGRTGEADLLRLAGALCPPLAMLHEKHIFHRDIAPDNILILDDGSPLLLDFGAARRLIGDMTQAPTVILKAGFAPIEQYAEMTSMRQGPWTDIYALCAVLYYCITGTPPVTAVARSVEDSLRPATEAGAGHYSPAFLAAIDLGLSVQPKGRPQSIHEFWGLLSAPTTVAPPPRSPPPPAAGGESPGRRSSALAVLVGLTVVAAAGAAAWRYLYPGALPVAAQQTSPPAASTRPEPAPTAPAPLAEASPVANAPLPSAATQAAPPAAPPSPAAPPLAPALPAARLPAAAPPAVAEPVARTPSTPRYEAPSAAPVAPGPAPVPLPIAPLQDHSRSAPAAPVERASGESLGAAVPIDRDCPECQVTPGKIRVDSCQSPQPKYPASARLARETGRVRLKVKLSATGRPVAIVIEKSSGFAHLDEAASNWLANCHYTPATENGVAVESFVRETLQFSLTPRE